MRPLKPAIFLILIALLSACVSQPYQVNSETTQGNSTSEKAAESKEESYMRIIGDLRWDKLTSLGEWEAKLPECASRLTDEFIQARVKDFKDDKPSGFSADELKEHLARARDKEMRLKYVREAEDANNGIVYLNEKGKRIIARNATPNCRISLGGITFRIGDVEITDNPSTSSRTMTSSVALIIEDASQARAFEAAIKEKYPSTIAGEDNPVTAKIMNYSQYTCFDFSSGIELTPTDYTISLLDAVKIKSDSF